MPTLLGAVAVAVGGLIVWRIARREWQRVNHAMDNQRDTGLPGERARARQLKRDPETGAYRPDDA